MGPLNRVLEEFREWQQPTLMLVGNHDQVCLPTSSSATASLRSSFRCDFPDSRQNATCIHSCDEREIIRTDLPAVPKGGHTRAWCGCRARSGAWSTA